MKKKKKKKKETNLIKPHNYQSHTQTHILLNSLAALYINPKIHNFFLIKRSFKNPSKQASLSCTDQFPNQKTEKKGKNKISLCGSFNY